MKKLITIAAVLSLVATATLQTGCTTAGSAAVSDARKLGEAYYKQPNVAEFLRIEGTNLSFTVSGASLVSLGAPVPPKQIIPREESWVHSTADVLKTVAPWIFMGYLFHSTDLGSGSTSSTVTNNTTP